MINHLIHEYRQTCFFAFLEYVYSFWVITWMEGVNNFQVAKVQPRYICLIFRQFQHDIAYKSVAYKKKRVLS